MAGCERALLTLFLSFVSWYYLLQLQIVLYKKIREREVKENPYFYFKLQTYALSSLRKQICKLLCYRAELIICLYRLTFIIIGVLCIMGIMKTAVTMYGQHIKNYFKLLLLYCTINADLLLNVGVLQVILDWGIVL